MCEVKGCSYTICLFSFSTVIILTKIVLFVSLSLSVDSQLMWFNCNSDSLYCQYQGDLKLFLQLLVPDYFVFDVSVCYFYIGVGNWGSDYCFYKGIENNSFDCCNWSSYFVSCFVFYYSNCYCFLDS